jgi:hypothetical protein
MTIGWRDGLATLLVAAILVPYIGYLVRGSMPFIQDPRGMAAAGLVLGVAAVVVLGRKAFRGTWGVTAGGIAVAAGGFGIIALLRAQDSEGLLAVFVAAVAIAWLLAELARTGLVQRMARRRRARRRSTR